MNDMLQPVDDTVRRQIKSLLRTARYASLAALEASDGAPTVSRVSVCTDIDGRPGFLMSRLSAHFAALERDCRCALMFGEPGKGDPLAHPRITVGGNAEIIPDEERPRFRNRFVEKNPKSTLYVDFGDMAFWRLTPNRVSFNGGFARAYAPETSDLLSDVVPELSEGEAAAVEHMNEDHADAVDHYAAMIAAADSGWRFACFDAEGFEIVRGDDVRRIWFEEQVTSMSELRMALAKMAKS